MKVVDIQPTGLVKVTGKGSKDRVVAVGRSGLETIQEYLSCRDSEASWLWVTPSGTRLSYHGLKGIIKRKMRG